MSLHKWIPGAPPKPSALPWRKPEDVTRWNTVPATPASPVPVPPIVAAKKRGRPRKGVPSE